MAHHRGAVALVLGVCLLMAACSSSHPNTSQASRSGRVRPTPPSNSTNIYAAAGKDMLSPAVAGIPYRLYAPDSGGDGVDVIDPTAGKVLDHYKTGLNPQHVVPSWDLKTLYVTNDLANTLTPIDPMTGKPSGLDIAVDDPYNMYFTPDGARAIVVAEAQQRLDFRDPHTFALTKQVPVDCKGVDHADFSADGAYLIATCEFSGKLVKVDLRTETVVGYLEIGGPPQDIKLDPQGRIFYVADMVKSGVHEIDAASFTDAGFIPTGKDAHGLYPSRDAKVLYVSNRRGGSITVIDFATRQLQRRHLRLLRHRRTPARQDPRRSPTARDVRVATTRPLLPRPHRRHPLTRRARPPVRSRAATSVVMVRLAVLVMRNDVVEIGAVAPRRARMHDHLIETRHAVEQCMVDLVRDRVRLRHRQPRIHEDLHFGVQAMTDPPQSQLIDTVYARDTRSNRARLLD
jgi:hypothetical protein